MSFTPTTLSPGSSPPFWGVCLFVWFGLGFFCLLSSCLISYCYFPRYCLRSSFLITYPPRQISSIPSASVLPNKLTTSKSVPWPSLEFHIHICSCIYHKIYAIKYPYFDIPQNLCPPKSKSLPIHPVPYPDLQHQDSPLTHILYLRRRLSSKFQRVFLWSISGIGCFSITTCFGPSFLLLGFVERPSLSVYKSISQCSAGIGLKQSWSWAHSA